MNVLRYEQGLEGDALKKAFTEYRAKHITPEEDEILKKACRTATSITWDQEKSWSASAVASPRPWRKSSRSEPLHNVPPPMKATILILASLLLFPLSRVEGKAKVFILSGQSNMAGGGHVVPEGLRFDAAVGDKVQIWDASGVWGKRGNQANGQV
jgi:hypothetical protein